MRNFLLAALMLTFGVSGMYADQQLVTFTAPGSIFTNNVFTLGYEFTTRNSINITALGVFDYGHDGFSAPEQVGLWTSGGTLLASAFVSSSDPLVGDFRYHSIKPVWLAPRADYVIGAQGPEPYTFMTFGSSTATDIYFRQDRYNYNGNSLLSSLVFPGDTEGLRLSIDGSYFGANAEFTSNSVMMLSAVPEPSSILLAITMLAGLGLIALRSKSAPQQN